jgi:hypothetical protein
MQSNRMIGRVLPVVAVLLLAPAQARAVTVEDIVALSKAGVADSVLIAVIDADQTVFDLTPQQIVDLTRAGVSNTVVVKMVGTAREFDGRQPREEPPTLVIIGERPPSPEPLPVPEFTVLTPFFFPAVSVNRGRLPERRDGSAHRDSLTHDGPPREQRDRGRDERHVNDGPAVGSGLRQPSVCVRGGWVGWCGSK